MKVYVKIVLLAIGAVTGLTIVNPTFGTFIGEKIGYFLGGSIVILGATSPILIPALLIWFVFFRKKATRKSNTPSEISGMTTDLVNNAAGQFGIGSSTSIAHITVPPDTSIERDRRTGASLGSVDQPPVPKLQSQAPGSATTEVPNSEPRDEIEDYPRGAIAIRYRAEIASDWSRVRLMPSEYKRMYLEKLDDNPDIDAQELYGIVDECLKRDAAPFSDEQTNKMYALLTQYGSEAQKRFKEVHAVLGASFNAEQVALEIEKDFSTEKFLDALEPHCYRTIGGVVFKKFANGGLKLLSINGIEQDVNQLSISDLLIQFDKFVNDFRSAVKVDFIEVRKAGNSTLTVTTDQNTYWLKSHAGEKSFGSIWEVYDYLGTPQSFRHKI